MYAFRGACQDLRGMRAGVLVEPEFADRLSGCGNGWTDAVRATERRTQPTEQTGRELTRERKRSFSNVVRVAHARGMSV